MTILGFIWFVCNQASSSLSYHLVGFQSTFVANFVKSAKCYLQFPSLPPPLTLFSSFTVDFQHLVCSFNLPIFYISHRSKLQIISTSLSCHPHSDLIPLLCIPYSIVLSHILLLPQSRAAATRDEEEMWIRSTEQQTKTTGITHNILKPHPFLLQERDAVAANQTQLWWCRILRFFDSKKEFQAAQVCIKFPGWICFTFAFFNKRYC